MCPSIPGLPLRPASEFGSYSLLVSKAREAFREVEVLASSIAAISKDCNSDPTVCTCFCNAVSLVALAKASPVLTDKRPGVHCSSQVGPAPGATLPGACEAGPRFAPPLDGDRSRTGPDPDLPATCSLANSSRSRFSTARRSHCRRGCESTRITRSSAYARWCGKGRRVTAAPMPINAVSEKRSDTLTGRRRSKRRPAKSVDR